jgi:5-(carboxyamino)imidazole ribonucleotide synthase
MIAPGGRVGILGGGQLGQMLALAARPLGYGIVVLAPESDCPAAGVADRLIRASFEDTEAARQLADACDVVTYEFENVPAATVRAIDAHRPVHPSARLLEVTQDRVEEHAFLHRLGIPTAPGRPAGSLEDVRTAVGAVGFPARLKTARGGYDGGGQWRLRGLEEVEALPPVFRDGTRCLVEGEVSFEREFSIVVTRSASGRVTLFPTFENRHAAGILRETTVPSDVPAGLQARAREIARCIAEDVALVGTLAVECFQAGDEVLVNELAPRVHNSGHLTIEACAVSQFEQHIRAICGLPLLEPTLRSPAAMVNLLGTEDRRHVRLEGADRALAEPGVHLHLYGKGERPRRKMGHLTALGATAGLALESARSAAGHLRFSPAPSRG